MYLILIFIFREGKGRRKKGRQTSMCGWVSRSAHWGSGPKTKACALTGNQTGDPLVRRPALNPVSYTTRAKIFFRKSFPDKKKLKEFITTKPVLYKMLRGLL